MAKKETKQPAYTQEFKQTAIQLVLTGNKSIAETARELDLPVKTLYNWMRKYKKKNVHFGGNNSSEELRKLQKRNKQLELENEILKKAAAYFAKTLM